MIELIFDAFVNLLRYSIFIMFFSMVLLSSQIAWPGNYSFTNKLVTIALYKSIASCFS